MQSLFRWTTFREAAFRRAAFKSAAFRKAVWVAAVVILPTVVLMSARTSEPLLRIEPMPSSAPPFMPPARAPIATDRAIEPRAAAERAMQRAQAALTDANYAFSTPEIPVRKPVWATVNDASETPSLQLSEQITHAEVIRLPDPQTLEKTPGDRLTVPLLEGRSLAVTVEEASRLANGDYSWRGYVEGEGDDFPVIFTVGKNSAFATITSLEGSYTMEAIGGVGWLYRNIVDRGEDSVAVP